MKYTSLDSIVRSVLQQRQLPIHYYLQYLKYAADCFRELHYSSLRVVHARMLPVDPKTMAFDLPCDYVDYVKVGIPVGQFITPLHYQQGINRLASTNSQGQAQLFPPIVGDVVSVALPGINFNEYGENLGRWFGYSDGLLGDTFKEIRERNIIQLNQSITGLTEAYLEYISDGTYANAATKVDPLAKKTIESYMKWQESPSCDDIFSREGKKYAADLRELRARKNPMTIEDIKRSFRKGQRASIK